MSFGENISWISAFPMDFFGHVSSNPSLSDLCQMLRLKTPCQVAAASRQKRSAEPASSRSNYQLHSQPVHFKSNIFFCIFCSDLINTRILTDVSRQVCGKRKEVFAKYSGIGIAFNRFLLIRYIQTEDMIIALTSSPRI